MIWNPKPVILNRRRFPFSFPLPFKKPARRRRTACDLSACCLPSVPSGELGRVPGMNRRRKGFRVWGLRGLGFTPTGSFPGMVFSGIYRVSLFLCFFR